MYKGIVVFTLRGLKLSVPVVTKACPKTEISRRWLAEKLSECVIDLCKSGFEVRGIVSDNHAANVSSFNFFVTEICTQIYKVYSASTKFMRKIFFYDNVHLEKISKRIC